MVNALREWFLDRPKEMDGSRRPLAWLPMPRFIDGLRPGAWGGCSDRAFCWFGRNIGQHIFRNW